MFTYKVYNLIVLQAYEFDPFTWKKEWTLIARFSNDDSKHWTKDGSFWYDRVIPYGDVNNPLGNTDMISEVFWTMKAREIKITRSDDSSHTALLQTTSNCLQGMFIVLVCREVCVNNIGRYMKGW